MNLKNQFTNVRKYVIQHKIHADCCQVVKLPDMVSDMSDRPDLSDELDRIKEREVQFIRSGCDRWGLIWRL